MGMESVVFFYVPNMPLGSPWDNVLSSLNILHEGQDQEQYIYTDHKTFWLDLLVEFHKALQQEILSVRVALCNSSVAMEKMIQLFINLGKNYKGHVLFFPEKGKPCKLPQIEQPEEQQKILVYYETKKNEFQKYFGTFQAAISADDVFSYAQKQKKISMINEM